MSSDTVLGVREQAQKAPQQRRRAVVASTIGTTIEWYDFFLYGTAAALVFPHLFFPHYDHYAGIIAAYATQFVGFLGRPLGAAIFGHFGDRLGRKATLIVTLTAMGLASAAMGLLPTYAAIGVTAPILLTALRLVQGLAVGGEWAGAVLLAMEWGSVRRRGVTASWPQLGVPLGLLGATAAVAVTSALAGPNFDTWGWRIPFLFSIVLVIIGLYVRLRVAETPAFDHVERARLVQRVPVLAAFRHQWRDVLLCAFVKVAEQAPFYIFITFVLTYGTRQVHLARSGLLNDTMIAAAAALIAVPGFGWLSDRIGRRLTYGLGIAGVAVIAFPYFGLLNTRDHVLVAVAIVVSLIVHSMEYGPQAALIAERFGANIRYSGAGLGYQLASLIAGGPAPLIAAAILAHTGSSVGISIYLIVCAAVSLTALLLMPRRDHQDMPHAPTATAAARQPVAPMGISG